MTAPAPDIVFLGNLLVDDIVLRDGRTLMGEPGGAVLHAALAAALWGVKVGICSIAGTDYPPQALDTLAARGIDLKGVRHLDRTGGRAWLLYEPAVRRTVYHLDCPSHGDISPTLADIPTAYAAARGFHLAPMPLSRQLDLAHGLAPAAGVNRIVSLDPFELVRDGTLAAWRDVLTPAPRPARKPFPHLAVPELHRRGCHRRRRRLRRRLPRGVGHPRRRRPKHRAGHRGRKFRN